MIVDVRKDGFALFGAVGGMRRDCRIVLASRLDIDTITRIPSQCQRQAVLKPSTSLRIRNPVALRNKQTPDLPAQADNYGVEYNRSVSQLKGDAR